MIVVTAGEPAGIGPDLIVLLAQQERSVPWLVVADKHMLQARAKQLHVPLQIDEQIDHPATASHQITVLHIPLAQEVVPGQLDVVNVAGVMAAFDRAIQGCMSGEFEAIVTGPMQKSVVNDAGVKFSGHTEYLCEASHVDDVVMLLVAGDLRVALATTHLPLAAVPAAITPHLLKRRLRILHHDLQARFQVAEPKILVAGLNPHAGEQGHLGREEIDVIGPVCAELNAQGLTLVGPLPADTLFTPQHLQNADAVMAMYHDQGLPVLKFAGFGEAVNVTLGLPFIRTSVDHGTALDRAGTGAIDSGSMTAALALAASMISVETATLAGGA